MLCSSFNWAKTKSTKCVKIAVKTILRSSFDLCNKKWGLTSYFLRKIRITAKKARFLPKMSPKTCLFGSYPSFFSKSSSSTPIFRSINQKMTSISSFTPIFTNFVGPVFVQLKLENSGVFLQKKKGIFQGSLRFVLL